MKVKNVTYDMIDPEDLNSRRLALGQIERDRVEREKGERE